MDCFTPSPKLQKYSRDTVRRRDRSDFLVPHESSIERPVRRLQLLQRLALDMNDEEQSAETLFRTFDLSIDGGASEDGLAALFCGSPRTRGEGGEAADNAYLSTPMRMKYFPTLSPTILRMLLRSPSEYSPSAASAGHKSAAASVGGSELLSGNEQEAEERFWLTGGSPGSDRSKPRRLSTQTTGMPLTPPPSARLPGSDKFSLSTPERMQETDITDMIDDPRYAVDSSAPALTLTAASSPRPGDASVLDRDRTRQYPLLSPTTLRHFLYVIEELKRTHDSHETLCASVSAPAALSASPCKRRPPAPDLQHESALNQEFAALLLAQAIDEEEHASELRRLADRLERIALTRRRLAGVTIAKTAGMSGQSKRE
ncbi:hypothetical protein OE88DRAFT_1731707 [Heliocybe sulcata]|uniref:Uncharacterized protein n=1 Tax=Heliocybe sulcata TaxID=5364 RepID=A0A5C3NDV1_9AGAM|nr:hypothetical protein OE88DRAFT_1731707 [Heliocybe sulcata]